MSNAMPNALQGEKIAVLVANGFQEQDLTSAQKYMQSYGGYLKVISMDNGLVNSWNGTSWGLNFAADSMLNEALAVDYSMLLVPGGRRSVDKLKLTAHTRRFVNGFLDTGKPLALFGEAVELLAHIDKMEGRAVSAQAEFESEVIMKGGTYSSDLYTVDGHLMTATPSDDSYEEVIHAVASHFAPNTIDQAA